MKTLRNYAIAATAAIALGVSVAVPTTALANTTATQASNGNNGKNIVLAAARRDGSYYRNTRAYRDRYYSRTRYSRHYYQKKRHYKRFKRSQQHRTYRRSYRRSSYSFPKQRQATGNRVFIFDPRRLQWAAYDPAGRLVKTGRASGGKHYCPDVRRACRTPRGQFAVYSKGSPGCRSSKYPLGRGGAPMPYCMFFHGGYAIHGGHVPGYNASHGCIRVQRGAARWLSKSFIRHGTTVIVRNY